MLPRINQVQMLLKSLDLLLDTLPIAINRQIQLIINVIQANLHLIISIFILLNPIVPRTIAAVIVRNELRANVYVVVFYWVYVLLEVLAEVVVGGLVDLA